MVHTGKCGITVKANGLYDMITRERLTEIVFTSPEDYIRPTSYTANSPFNGTKYYVEDLGVAKLLDKSPPGEKPQWWGTRLLPVANGTTYLRVIGTNYYTDEYVELGRYKITVTGMPTDAAPLTDTWEPLTNGQGFLSAAYDAVGMGLIKLKNPEAETNTSNNIIFENRIKGKLDPKAMSFDFRFNGPGKGFKQYQVDEISSAHFARKYLEELKNHVKIVDKEGKVVAVGGEGLALSGVTGVDGYPFADVTFTVKAGLLKGSEQYTLTFDPSTPSPTEETIQAVRPWKALHFTFNTQDVPLTVSFAAGEGTPVPEDQTINQGQPVTEPMPPTRADHTFDGWYTDESFATQWDFSAPVDEDMTLYAKWTEIPREKLELVALSMEAWARGTETGMIFKSNAELKDLQAVYVDGKEVADKNMDIKSGSTIVTLKPEFLNTLSVGEHTFAMEFRKSDTVYGGRVETTFMIAEAKADQDGDTEKENISGEEVKTVKPVNNEKVVNVGKKAPKTGDESIVGMLALFMIAGAGICIRSTKRKHD